MNKEIYTQLIEMLYQYMDIEVSNNLIWGGNKEFSTKLFLECGYAAIDWSWYDGHIVTTKSTQYPGLSVNYAACVDSYCFICDEPKNHINIQVEEVGKLSSAEKRAEYDFNSITVKQANGKGHEHTDITATVPTFSPEFDAMVKELYKWQKTFDKSAHFDYSITIYIGKEVNLNEL